MSRIEIKAAGQTVISIDDDRNTPLTGVVLGWEDEDRCLVAWGDSRYAENPWDEACIEAADELTTLGRI